MQRLRAANGDLQRSCLEASRQLEESRRLHAKVSADELGVCLQSINPRFHLWQIVELESYECSIGAQRCAELTSEVERLKSQNQSLQDQNDELLAEKDTLRQQVSRQNSLILNQHQQHSPGILRSAPPPMLDANGNLVLSEQQTASATSSVRNKRKRRRKKKKKKSSSLAAATTITDNTTSETSTKAEAGDGGTSKAGTSECHFDDNMSTVSSTTIDTCTTADTDFGDHQLHLHLQSSSSSGGGVHMRSGSQRLSRSNSAVEKRQRILFRTSRHSLDDEPLPIEGEDDDDGTDQVVHSSAAHQQQQHLWDNHHHQHQQFYEPAEVMAEREEDAEECLEEGEEEEDDDDDDDLEEEDPRTMIDEGDDEGGAPAPGPRAPSALTRHYSSLSEEISEWASGRERARQREETLRGAIEQVLLPVRGGTAQEGASSTSEAIHSAIEKIKDGLYLAMVEVMDGGGRRGGGWHPQTPPNLLEGNTLQSIL